MIKRICILFFAFIVLMTEHANAQDPHFTQFYAAPLFLNPAYAGSNVCARMATNYRNQWPSIKKAYVTYVAAFDHSIPSKNSGVGLLFVNDKAGSGELRSTKMAGQYAYEALLTRRMAIRFGIECSYNINDIDIYKLVFGDQIARNSNTSLETRPRNQVTYFDFATGVLLYTYRYWYGLSVHHLNTPNQSLIEGNSKLPMEYSFHSGFIMPVGKSRGTKKISNFKESISPAINYKHQGKYDQIDMGFYYMYNPLTLGVWYRGIPLLKKYQPGLTYLNQDALAFLVGITTPRFKTGYSYDLNISRLISTSGGVHEISLSFQMCDIKKLKRQKKKPKLIIPCPKF